MPYIFYYSSLNTDSFKNMCFVNTDEKKHSGNISKCKKCKCIIPRCDGTGSRQCKKSACMFGDYCNLHMKMKWKIELKKIDGKYGIFAIKDKRKKIIFKTGDVIHEQEVSFMTKEKLKKIYHTEEINDIPYWAPFDQDENEVVYLACENRTIETFIKKSNVGGNVSLNIYKKDQQIAVLKLIATKNITSGEELLYDQNKKINLKIEGSTKTFFL